MVKKSRMLLVARQVGAFVSVISLSIGVAAAAQEEGQAAASRNAAAAASEAIEEVVVTGSRIATREGYEAPTPVTVIVTEMLERSADANMLDTLATIPAITGSQTAVRSAHELGQAQAGIQAVNLRSLGTGRVLVLLDGQRTVGSNYANLVDLTNFPTQLISRVEVVTGGASAVYGSDAVTGVVNFVLDRQFTGLKSEISGGITNYGDDENYEVSLSAGFGFAGGRGHVLLSGKHSDNQGIPGNGVTGQGGRDYLTSGHLQFPNATYSPTNGEPQLYRLGQSAVSSMAPGGIIVAGPLRGTAFGAGGTPFTFDYGPTDAGQFMTGGDWRINNAMLTHGHIDPSQSNQNVFTRVSYDVSDNVNVYVQYMWSKNRANSLSFPLWLPGSATAYVIQDDNPYIPATVRAAMTANGVTSFPIGTWNLDMPQVTNDGERVTNRITAGLEGQFDAFNTNWNWDAYYAYGSVDLELGNSVPVRARYREAIDAVVNPANGEIVCRVTLTDSTSGCMPWNVMGTGVNAGNLGVIEWMTAGGASQSGQIEQTVMAASVRGDPFSLWAGPVSLAGSLEWREDEINAESDAFSSIGGRVYGNLAPLVGKQSVTEGALEMLIPLANGENWAQAWDLSLATRLTDYELSGRVTTWKVGTTYTPIDDITLRMTRSRDIRAPNLQELFATPQVSVGGAGLIDRFLGGITTPLSAVGATGGNVDLDPEEGDTFSIGMVLRPRFLDDFTASVDYWNVTLNDAIQPIGGQQVIDGCFFGTLPSVCQNIIRDSDGFVARINLFPVNVGVREVRGVDLEASYRVPLWQGDLSLHGLMTIYLRNYEDTTFTPPTDQVGRNAGSNAVPDWKFSATATYTLDPISASLTARGFSDGKVDTRYIECTSGCPAATAANPTINDNSMPGRLYFDANVNYEFSLGESASADLFFSVKNIFDETMPAHATAYWFNYTYQNPMYDPFGRIYYAGIRFRM